ncbi:MAG: HAMP domain-containing sensor histidine kinase [Peptoniphilus sp.]|nr:HAMP domain-containing sensor histidine kinase [Peptoniphilus sp.]MDD7362669.1 HAMP domain-containing sensor histidine kinase [Bacillota bacterium]MDY6044932.1 HAMP domain-containing sensor histidine kinase [Peptoniphilus sp.]
MSVFSNRDSKKLLIHIVIILIAGAAVSQWSMWKRYSDLSLPLFIVSLVSTVAIAGVVYRYLKAETRMIEEAEEKIDAYIEGNLGARIFSDREGPIYRLFDSINGMSTILESRAADEIKVKKFLRDIISDISHQIKTPLAALSIYNGLICDEADDHATIAELSRASERELDRLNTLVQNLLKLARLDAGVMALEKSAEDVCEFIGEVECHFSYRVKEEGKSLHLWGEEGVELVCDRDWMIEALSNLVKNALDHTRPGDRIDIRWEASPSMLQMSVSDTGSGIREEDLYHIFKRFYQSKIAQDRQGLGLGLPLSKAIVEAHGGTIEVLSEWGKGTTFLLNIPNPTRL